MKYILTLFLLSSCSPTYYPPSKKEKVDMVRLREASRKAAKEAHNELRIKNK